MVKVNFSDVQDFSPLPAGVYPAILDDVTFKDQADKPGKFPYVNWEFVLTDEHEGRKIWCINSFSPKSLFRLHKTLVAFGEEPGELDGEFEFEPTDYIGAEVNLVLTVGLNDKGKERNEVDTVLPVGDAPEPAKESKDGKKKKKSRRRVR